MIPSRLHLSIASIYLVLLLLNSSNTVVFASTGTLQPAHKCISKSAASTIHCSRKGTKKVKSYCGSTRSSPIAAAANSALDESKFQVIRDVVGKIEFGANKTRRTRESLFLTRTCTNFWKRRRQRARGSSEGQEYLNFNQEKWVQAASANAYRNGLPPPASNFLEFKSAVDSRL